MPASYPNYRKSLDRMRYVYATLSRRSRGLSIGLNLNPDKVCNFACPYCQVDRTIPGPTSRVDVEELVSELDRVLSAVQDGSLWTLEPFASAPMEARVARDLAYAGDGEPTLRPELGAVTAVVRRLRDARAPDLPIRLLTNATRLRRPGVIRALDDVDEVWCKLDAGTAAWFRRVDGTRVRLETVLAGLLAFGQRRPIVIQSMFHRFGDEAPSSAERDAWAGRLRDLLAGGCRIDRVQVYTVARTPAQPDALPLSLLELKDVADRARALGLPVEVHGPWANA